MRQGAGACARALSGQAFAVMSMVEHLRRWPRRFRKLARLRPLDLVQLPLLAVLLMAIDVGLRKSRVERVARVVGVRFLPDETVGDGEQPEPFTRAERRWIDNAARLVRRWPLDATCLRRSLMLGWILRKRQPTLTIGVRKENGELKAHAWIRLGSKDLDAGAADYLPFGDEIPAPSASARERA